jgi:hypothetical protein
VRLVHTTGPQPSRRAQTSQEATVLTAHGIRHPTILCALACALLVTAVSGSAAARPNHGTRAAAALAQERYYSSYAEPQPSGASALAARAQERYYSSYGESQPLTPSQPPATTDDTPWLPIALAAAAVLTIATASATRLRIRRRLTARVRA